MNSVSVERFAENPEITLLKLRGSIGLDLVPRISALVDEFYGKGRLHWAVDLSEVTFLSSPAVGALMGLRSRVIGREGSVALVSAGPGLAEKLNLMGVNLVIPSYRSPGSFLEHFRWEYRDASREMDLELPSVASIVPPTRRLVVGLLGAKGFGEKDAFIVESIVDELANNAIEHGKPTDGVFRLSLKFDKKKVALTVSNSCEELSDEDRKFLVEKFEHPRVDPGSLRGRGILLVKRLSTQMTCRVEPRRVEVGIVRMREKK